MKKVINPEGAPKPVGPYSQSVRAGDWLYISGQVSIDPESQEFLHGSVEEQARLVMENLKAVVKGVGGTMENVVKCHIYLSDMIHSPVVNEIYSEYFGDKKPARITVAVKGIAADLDVEIDAIAYLGND